MTYNAVENSKIYNEGFLFEILINRLLGTGLDDRYPELSNLMDSEEGKLFIRTPDNYLKKTKNCLNNSLNLFIKNKIISNEKKFFYLNLCQRSKYRPIHLRFPKLSHMRLI